MPLACEYPCPPHARRHCSIPYMATFVDKAFSPAEVACSYKGRWQKKCSIIDDTFQNRKFSLTKENDITTQNVKDHIPLGAPGCHSGTWSRRRATCHQRTRMHTRRPAEEKSCTAASGSRWSAVLVHWNIKLSPHISISLRRTFTQAHEQNTYLAYLLPASVFKYNN